jgi:hypothetical protein
MKLSLERLARQIAALSGGGSEGMQVITLSADPTVTPTAGVFGVVGLWNGAYYWHVTALTDIQWINLGDVKLEADRIGDVMMLTSAADPIMQLVGAGVKFGTVEVPYTAFQSDPNAVVGVVSLGDLGSGGLHVCDGRLIVKTQFAAGSLVVQLQLGGNTGFNNNLLVDLLDATVEFAQSRTGEGIPSDQLPANIYVSCRIENAFPMSYLTAGVVVVQVWWYGEAP